MSTEQRFIESKKRAALRAIKVKEVEVLQFLQADANAKALAKQSVVQALAMFKGKVVNQFTAYLLDSTGSTLSSVTAMQACW
jgi:hypothetical protein